MRRVLLLLACTACSPDQFFVRSDGADLPVWVRGPTDASTWVIVTHGSGSSGALYDPLPAFDALEQEQAVVYWDQRGAGVSQGNAAADTLDHDASVADLGLVLAAVRERYDPRRVVLLGHSLGGGISQAFLTEGSAGVAGYVDVSGGRSLPEAYRITRDRMIALAEGFAADRPDERRAWEAMRDFYEATPAFPRQEPDRSTHAAHVVRVLDELGYDQVQSSAEMAVFLTGAGLGQTVRGGFDVLQYSTNTAGFLGTFDFDGMDLTAEQVGAIDVPVLAIAGRFDLSVPVEVSQATVDAAGPDAPPRRLVVLERSGHFPMWDQPDPFTDAVQGFLDDEL